jgi:hypothetical protein
MFKLKANLTRLRKTKLLPMRLARLVYLQQLIQLGTLQPGTVRFDKRDAHYPA